MGRVTVRSIAVETGLEDVCVRNDAKIQKLSLDLLKCIRKSNEPDKEPVLRSKKCKVQNKIYVSNDVSVTVTWVYLHLSGGWQDDHSSKAVTS